MSLSRAEPTDHADLAIVGVGAAGMFAAIHAGQHAPPGMRIVALDGAKTLGAKILVAGGGRCNVTHDVVTPDDYAGGSRNAVAKVLRTFSVQQTIDWFQQQGVKLKREDTGKLFPVTDSARTVLNALLKAMADAGVDVQSARRVTEVQPEAEGFRLHTSTGPMTCSRLILATGGKALPRSGSDGLGYTFAQNLGHTINQTTPALVPLKLPADHWITQLSGIALDTTLTLRAATGKPLAEETGPTLFTHFGLSGPAPMNLSRHWLAQTDAVVTANLAAQPFDAADQTLQERARQYPKQTVAVTLFRAFGLPQRLAEALPRQELGMDPTQAMTHLNKEDRRALAHALTALPLPIVGDRGYTHAEVTAGGVPLNEINLKSMASRVHERLWLCGELLDVDGRIGGYNFQWAWCTGRLAGTQAVLPSA